MDRAKAVIGHLACLILAVLFYLIFKSTEIVAFFGLSWAALAGMIVCSFFNRCPHCGCSLHRHHFFIEYCPHCGERL